MERKGLGRGLDALITPTASQGDGVREKVQTIKLSQVRASKLQPRLRFDEAKIEQLARSIKEKGVIQPILVRASSDGTYELIAGERRLRATKLAGLDEIPAIVRRVPDAELLEMSIIENIQREELNPVEEAKAYRRLAQDFGFSQDAIAQKVGKDKTSISNLLRILNLPSQIQTYLEENQISLGHAKALLGVSDEKSQIKFCEAIVKKGLSVREAERWGTRRRPRRAPASGVSADPNVRELEERLQHRFGTRVRIKHGKSRGTIEIEYLSLADLDRILALLGAN